MTLPPPGTAGADVLVDTPSLGTILDIFSVPPVHKTSKITRATAAEPGGEHFPIYQQHIHEHSHLKALREISSPLYSFHNNVRNKCCEMRNKALCYVSLRRKLHRRTSGLKLNGAGGLLVRCTPRSSFKRLWAIFTAASLLPVTPSLGQTFPPPESSGRGQ